MMKPEIIAIVDHAVRWSNNILTEVLGNYDKYLGDRKRNALAEAVKYLGEAMRQDNDDG